MLQGLTKFVKSCQSCQRVKCSIHLKNFINDNPIMNQRINEDWVICRRTAAGVGSISGSCRLFSSAIVPRICCQSQSRAT